MTKLNKSGYSPFANFGIMAGFTLAALIITAFTFVYAGLMYWVWNGLICGAYLSFPKALGIVLMIFVLRNLVAPGKVDLNDY